jgi:subtilisin family serine protease
MRPLSVALLLALPALARAGEEAPEKFDVYHVECVNEKACEELRGLLETKHGKGARVITHFKEFFDVLVTQDGEGREAVAAVAGSDFRFWHERGGTYEAPPPPRSAPGIGKRGPEDLIVRGPVHGLEGSNVIVAILDTGLDFHNRDFLDEKGQTRLLYYWDTLARRPSKFDLGLREEPPIRTPRDVPVGTLYTREELNEAIRDNDRSVWTDDELGHGTGCATIAAGNGRASDGKHRGVAPKADLIAVRVGKERNMDTGYLLNAVCGWLDEVGRERNKPVVVSCSFGGTFGGYDGQSVETRQLNARFAPDVSKRVLCISAGNDGYEPIHAEAKLPPGGKVLLRWKAPGPKSPTLKLLFDTGNLKDVRFEGDLAEKAAAALHLHKPSKEVRCEFSVPEGEGTLTVKAAGERAVRLDAYALSWDKDGRMNGEFVEPQASFSRLVKSPGATPNALTVGSYDWNPRGPDGRAEDVTVSRTRTAPMRVGALSPYSGPGPSRNADPAAALKPDFVAPGQWYVVNRPAGLSEGSGGLKKFNGTSAATPYVAGVVALMLQARPGLTSGEVKRWLASAAREDDFTEEYGKLPNSHWGRGKLTAESVRAMLKEIKDGKETPK